MYINTEKQHFTMALITPHSIICSLLKNKEKAHLWDKTT